MNLGVAGFTAGFWGNVDMTDINSSELDDLDTEWKFTEIDWTLGYGMTLPFIEFGLGLIYYDFPQIDDAETLELYLSAEANVGQLAVSVSEVAARKKAVPASMVFSDH